MPGEYPGKVAKDYVEDVCLFLEGNFGFHVFQTAYEGKDAAGVLVDGEKIRVKSNFFFLPSLDTKYP